MTATISPTIEERVEADLALGRHDELLGELTSLVERHPLRERVRMQLMLALYRCGREAEALDSYQRFRCALSEELGLDPGPRLQRLEAEILARDPSLDHPLAKSPVIEPLPSPSALPTNLPSELSSFVGRKAELEQTVALLARSRLLTLTGVGGVGKTRLALHLASDALDHHADGVWWLELAPLQDPGLVGTTLVAALRVRPLPGQSETDAAVSYLCGREALLVFDNCEHVLEPVGRLVEAPLRGCPRLRVLATSREPLGVEGETDWRVPSLSLAGDSDRPREDPTASDAARLFAERAAEVTAGFSVTAENTLAVIRICRAVDGIPLALELAAARVRLLSVDQIADGLADSLRLLSRGPRTRRPRQQRLRASIAWSNELLNEQERMLFRRLAVFLGGFTLEAAQEICSDEALPAPEVLDLLDALVQKSLTEAEPQGSGVRCRLLEPVRQYALERLAEAGEAEKLRDRHRDAYLAVAEQGAHPGCRRADAARSQSRDRRGRRGVARSRGRRNAPKSTSFVAELPHDRSACTARRSPGARRGRGREGRARARRGGARQPRPARPLALELSPWPSEHRRRPPRQSSATPATAKPRGGTDSRAPRERSRPGRLIAVPGAPAQRLARVVAAPVEALVTLLVDG